MSDANNHPKSSRVTAGGYLTRFIDWFLALSERFPIAEGIAILGVIHYTIQSWRFAHLLNSTLDEGSYLFKGYAFATGD